MTLIDDTKVRELPLVQSFLKIRLKDLFQDYCHIDFWLTGGVSTVMYISVVYECASGRDAF